MSVKMLLIAGVLSCGIAPAIAETNGGMTQRQVRADL